MGATSFYQQAYGYNAYETFEQMKEKEAYEHGHDYYNGYGYSASLEIVESKGFKTYADKNIKSVKKFIEQKMECGCKNVISCIDLGVIQYEIREYKKKSLIVKGLEPKYALEYSVHSGNCERDLIIYSNANKKIAEDWMLANADKYPTSYTTKEYVLKKGSNNVSEVVITKKVVKKKPETLKPNQKLKELHKYVYFGMVSM